MLNVNKSTDNGTMIIALEGRLDTVTAPEFGEELRGSLEGVTELILDLEKLEYL